MKDDSPIEQEDKETSSGLLQHPKGSIHVIILVNSFILFTIKIFSIKKLTDICVILSLTCLIMKSSLVYLPAFLGTRNDIHMALLCPIKLLFKSWEMNIVTLSHMGCKSRVTILEEQDMMIYNIIVTFKTSCPKKINPKHLCYGV